MKEALNAVITNLVSNQDAVSIKEIEGEKVTKFEVTVAKEDMGKVIGKDGKNAKAIRTIMKSLSAKEHKRVTVEFMN